MALNDVALSSRALIRIGAAPISSFDDGTAESQVAGALYRSVCDALLSAYGWSFATGQVALNQLAPDGLAQEELAEFGYVYALPTDFLRALSAGHGARASGVAYRLKHGKLYSNVNGLVLTYVFRPDESSFPPYFDQALITRLAAEFTIPITESTSRAEVMFRLAEAEFQRARQIDAQQDTPSALQHFPLVDIRG